MLALLAVRVGIYVPGFTLGNARNAGYYSVGIGGSLEAIAVC